MADRVIPLPGQLADAVVVDRSHGMFLVNGEIAGMSIHLAGTGVDDFDSGIFLPA
jgi:hypothetical protein